MVIVSLEQPILCLIFLDELDGLIYYAVQIMINRLSVCWFKSNNLSRIILDFVSNSHIFLL